jgi:hypothetical protein
MTDRGKVSNGVAVLDGPTPPEGPMVEVTPLVAQGTGPGDPAQLPAFGPWRGRTDLPADTAQAARVLRERAERRAHD